MPSYIPTNFTNEAQPSAPIWQEDLERPCPTCRVPHIWQLSRVRYTNTATNVEDIGTLVTDISYASEGGAIRPLTIVPDSALSAAKLAFERSLQGGSGQGCSSIELMKDVQATVCQAGLGDTFSNTFVANAPCVTFDDVMGVSWQFYPDNLPLSKKDSPQKPCGSCGGDISHETTLLSGHFKSTADSRNDAMARGTIYFTSTTKGGEIKHTIQALLPDSKASKLKGDPLGGQAMAMVNARTRSGRDPSVWCTPAIFREALVTQAAAGEGRAHIAKIA